MMKENAQSVKVDISFLTIVKVVGALLALYVAYVIREVFALLFVAMILSALIDPFADLLEKKKIPRAFAVLLIYAGLIGILAAIIIGLVPPLTTEFGQLLGNLGGFAEQLVSSYKALAEVSQRFGGVAAIEQSVNALQAGLTGGASGIFATLQDVVAGLIAFALVLALTFYLVVEEQAVRKFFRSVTPHRYHAYLSESIPRVQEKLGAWLRGQLFIALTIAVLDFIGLRILGVRYALVLALFAGLAEFVPYVGPFVSTILVFTLTFVSSPYLGFAVLVLYICVQWTNNHVLVPKIMQRVVGINPIVSIIAFLVGAKLGGIVGAIFAIPVAAGVLVFTQDFFAREEPQHSTV